MFFFLTLFSVYSIWFCFIASFSRNCGKELILFGFEIKWNRQILPSIQDTQLGRIDIFSLGKKRCSSVWLAINRLHFSLSSYRKFLWKCKSSRNQFKFSPTTILKPKTLTVRKLRFSENVRSWVNKMEQLSWQSYMKKLCLNWNIKHGKFTGIPTSFGYKQM